MRHDGNRIALEPMMSTSENPLMKIGVFLPPNIPESFRVCVENLSERLPDFGCELVFSDQSAELSRTDLVWDPRAGGGYPPHDSVLHLGKPLVVTLHGVAPLAIPKLYTKGLRNRLSLFFSNTKKRKAWRHRHQDCARIVTVSNFSRSSIVECLGIPEDKIEVVYNGVNQSVFSREGPCFERLEGGRPYFLHISNDEQRKNVDRILSAYAQLEPNSRWPLILKLSSRRGCTIPGVIMLKQRLSDEEIASLYRGSGAFVFPSLYEGFGLPIVEAMATGCPVITSNGNACAEVAGSAAKLVNPLSVQELRAAMIEVMDQHGSSDLPSKGVVRAAQFNWHAAASDYARIFREVLGRQSSV